MKYWWLYKGEDSTVTQSACKDNNFILKTMPKEHISYTWQRNN